MSELSEFRAQLGAVGFWHNGFMTAPAEHERAAVRRLEALGYGSVFTGEIVGGKETMAHHTVLLAATQRIVVGTGIANVWARHPASMEGAGTTIGEAFPSRFILGVGVSHASLVARTGQTYSKPLAQMSSYLDGMDAAAALAGGGLRAAPRMLAALRPRMLGLARDRADGALPYFVPVQHTSLAREILGPDKLLIPEQAVVLCADPASGRARAHEHILRYLQIPNYVNNLRQLGYTDDDLSGPGSDRLVNDMVAFGDEGVIRERVREHLDRGADHVLIQPLGGLDNALDQAAGLATALLPEH